jgi:hypothetical protein
MKTDNYAAMMTAIANFILTHAPEGLRANTRERLGDADVGRSGRIGGDFERFAPDGSRQASCDLYVSFERPRYRPTEDEEGNLWAEYALKVEINWPSFGSAGVEAAQRRIVLMQEVLDLAAAIECEFGATQINQLYKSKTEIDADAAVDAARKVQERAAAIVATCGKGMRAGGLSGSKLLDDETCDLPAGHYEIAQGDRKFTLSVTETGHIPGGETFYTRLLRRIA